MLAYRLARRFLTIRGGIERAETEPRALWVTVENGIETVEPDNEPLSSKCRKLDADLVELVTPSSQM